MLKADAQDAEATQLVVDGTLTADLLPGIVEVDEGQGISMLQIRGRIDRCFWTLDNDNITILSVTGGDWCRMICCIPESPESAFQALVQPFAVRLEQA